MGSCFSKKIITSPPTTSKSPDPPAQIQFKPDPDQENPKQKSFKKEVFIIKHRRSHEIDRQSEQEMSQKNHTQMPIGTSSCTKEELDAILVQCGRLSRSSTRKASGSGSNGLSEDTGGYQRGRKYSGSKKSFDFDCENGEKDVDGVVSDDEDDESLVDRIRRHRASRTASCSPNGRRRTPSREREPQQRSGSRERGGDGCGGRRRVSRSPGRRSESPSTTISNASSLSGNGNGTNGRPGKMVYVPATVNSLANDRSTSSGGGIAEQPSVGAIMRVQVKRCTASPRSRSPALGSQHQHHQSLYLSRSNSRKAEHSPYRRNPLYEIETNVDEYEQGILINETTIDNVLHQKPIAGNPRVIQVAQEADTKGSCNRSTKGQQKTLFEEAKGVLPMNANVTMTMMPSDAESLKPQVLPRSRSSRLSRDLDTNPETVSNPNPSYTALLLEDIHNFHQKSAPSSAFTLPPCVTKACSILEAVADLNSGTSLPEDRIRNPSIEKFSNDNRSGDITEPSFHKYVTVRRGATVEGGDMEEEESSGSNSFVGSHHHWLSSSSWEPNSADSSSTDCYTSSRTYSRDRDSSPLGFQNNAFSQMGHNIDEPNKKRISGNQHNGIGRGRLDSAGLYMMPSTAAAST